MKYSIKKIFLILSMLFIATSAFAKEKTMYVAGKNVPLKENSNIFSKQINTLPYATAVEVLSSKGSWKRIRVINDYTIIGWVKESNLTSKKLSAVSVASTDADEIALAGKGSENKVNSNNNDEVEFVETEDNGK